MDNKKMYHKLMQFFWFTMMTLPLWIAIIQFIGFSFGGGAIDNSSDLIVYNQSNSFVGIFENILNSFMTYTPTSLNNIFVYLFNNVFGVSTYFIAYLLSWIIWVALLHLVLDFLIMFINLLHDFKDRFLHM